MNTVHPVILCGGAGSRLWPLSRTLLPKQFLPLASENTMLQETVLRLRGARVAAMPLVVAGEEHRFMVADQLLALGVSPRALLLEPVGRNTAPAVAAAALALMEHDEQGTMLVLPADHVIRNSDAFHEAIDAAVRLAADGWLVTFGLAPESPATGYGYIRRGEALGGRAYRVARFVEKPALDQAREYVASGEYSWNSGMFAFKAARYLEELEQYRPDMLQAVRRALAKARRDLDFLRLDAESFAACPGESIDYAVMEKTRRACVVEADLGWNDIGSWSALWEVAQKDANGNSVRGDVYLDRAKDCYIRSEERLVAAVGVEHLVVVETADAVLVASKDSVQDVKQAVEHLKSSRRNEHFSHRRVYRPWGYYESIDQGSRFQVKRLMLKPGAKISLQLHRRRAEHWVVVSGRARVTRGEDLLVLRPNQSTYIPPETLHRLENAGEGELFVIEVQSGDYLGEDDIERYADDYRRD